MTQTPYAYNRYSFRDRSGHNGANGEIPIVNVINSEEIPPLSLLQRVDIFYASKERPGETELRFFWITQKIIIRLVCRINSEGLKVHLQRYPEVVDDIINFIESCLAKDCFREPPEKRKTQSLVIGKRLDDESVPEAIRPFIRQAETWHDFIHGHKVSQFRYCSQIHDGYYFYYISWIDLKIPDYCENSWEDDIYLERFCFEPPNIPYIEEDGIFWLLRDEKIAIVLPHQATSLGVARYYGYEHTLREYRRREREAEEDRRQRFARLDQAEEEERRDKIKALRSTILGAG